MQGLATGEPRIPVPPEDIAEHRRPTPVPAESCYLTGHGNPKMTPQ